MNDVPTELLYHIFSFLDLFSLFKLLQINRLLNSIIKDDYLWKEYNNAFDNIYFSYNFSEKIKQALKHPKNINCEINFSPATVYITSKNFVAFEDSVKDSDGIAEKFIIKLYKDDIIYSKYLYNYRFGGEYLLSDKYVHDIHSESFIDHKISDAYYYTNTYIVHRGPNGSIDIHNVDGSKIVSLDESTFLHREYLLHCYDAIKLDNYLILNNHFIFDISKNKVIYDGSCCIATFSYPFVISSTSYEGNVGNITSINILTNEQVNISVPETPQYIDICRRVINYNLFFIISKESSFGRLCQYNLLMNKMISEHTTQLYDRHEFDINELMLVMSVDFEINVYNLK